MIVDVGRMSVVIDLKPSIYVLYPESGIGKTYLYSLIKAANSEGQDVVAFTYSDANQGIENLISNLKSRAWRFVILDRYDLYENIQISNVLSELKCPVLVDLKCTRLEHFGWDNCELDLSENRIRLYVDDI